MKVWAQVKWVYCWHALAAYWAGVHSSMSKYDPRTLYPQPAAGVLEVDPSMAWSCQVLHHPPLCTFKGGVQPTLGVLPPCCSASLCAEL